MTKERIKEIRNHLKLSQQELADSTNSKRTTVAGYEQGVSLPDAEFLLNLNKTYNVNIIWLLTGEGQPFIKEDISETKPIIMKELEKIAVNITEPKFTNLEKQIQEVESELEELKKAIKNMNKTALENFINADKTKDREPLYSPTFTNSVAESTTSYEDTETVKLPLIENLAAGIPIEACDLWETFTVPKYLVKRKKENYCVAHINGSSMYEVGIPDNCYILLEKSSTPIEGETMVVRYEDTTTLKQCHKTKRGIWELLYRDGSQAKIELKDGQWEVLAKFIAVV